MVAVLPQLVEDGAQLPRVGALLGARDLLHQRPVEALGVRVQEGRGREPALRGVELLQVDPAEAALDQPGDRRAGTRAGDQPQAGRRWGRQPRDTAAGHLDQVQAVDHEHDPPGGADLLEQRPHAAAQVARRRVVAERAAQVGEQLALGCLAALGVDEVRDHELVGMPLAALGGVGGEQRRDAAARRAGDDDAGPVRVDRHVDRHQVGATLDGVADQPRGVRLLVDRACSSASGVSAAGIQLVDERQQVGAHQVADAARVGVVADREAGARTRSLRSARRSRPSAAASSYVARSASGSDAVQAGSRR